MPRFDGTGPWGAGSMTGGGRGYCNPAFAGSRPFYGRGFGRGGGFGRGRGLRRGFGLWCGWDGWYGPVYGPAYPRPYAVSREDELNMLRNEADAIHDELDAINKRIEELEKESPA